MWKCPKCGREFSRQEQDHYCVKPKNIDEYISAQDEAFQPGLKEIRNLIFKDNLLNLIIGWILGIPVGLFFLSLYVKAVSTSSIMYRPYLQFKSFLIASAITIGCSMIVNYVVSMKISKIDMVEALKSVE